MKRGEESELDEVAARLRSALEPRRERGPAEADVEALRARLGPRSRPRMRMRRGVALALAAAVVAALAAGLWRRASEPPGRTYEVHSLAGRPTLVGAVDRLVRGGWLETDAASRARLRIGGIGHVELGPGGRLALREPRDPGAEHALELERGTLRATIFAKPRAFQLGTPAGIAVDLGCIYTTTVEDDGAVRLAVESGAVSFEADGRRLVVPAGAEVAAVAGRLGTPVWSDAPEELRAWVAALGDLGAEQLAALEGFGERLRPRDAWTLLQVPSEGAERERLLALAEDLCAPPGGGSWRAAAGSSEALADWVRAARGAPR